jgi:hypothetical protein
MQSLGIDEYTGLDVFKHDEEKTHSSGSKMVIITALNFRLRGNDNRQ